MQRAQLRAGETLLVHGAAGGSDSPPSISANSMVQRSSRRPVATRKLAVVKQLGADHLINYSGGFRDAVKELTGGRGADVIYDPVGGDVFDESMRCIAPFGRILIVGFTSGRSAVAKTNHLLIKDAAVIGYTVGALQRHDPAWAKRNADTLLGWLASGRIKPYISHRVPLERTADALKLIIDRKVIGKAMVI
jgi:NADPH2:quinone reductase